jgi:iron complex transport system ATP-binding protein
METLALHQAGIKIDGRWLVQQASLTLSSGQLTALIGPNGAGKTTLLRLLAGLWQPSKGLVTLNKSPLPQRRELAQHISFVPQNTTLDFAFTVKDIVMMGRNPHLGRFQPETEYDDDCVEQAMIKTDIIHLAQRPVTELSGGERQRVLIARSLATQAQMMLLDEPTASLDVAHALDVLELLKKLAKEGQTIAFSMHDINYARRYADQLVLIHQGRIFDIGSADNVLTDEAMTEVFGVSVEKVTVSADDTVLFFRPYFRSIKSPSCRTS